MMGNREKRMLPELGYEMDKFPPDKTIFNAIFNPFYQRGSYNICYKLRWV